MTRDKIRVGVYVCLCLCVYRQSHKYLTQTIVFAQQIQFARTKVLSLYQVIATGARHYLFRRNDYRNIQAGRACSSRFTDSTRHNAQLAPVCMTYSCICTAQLSEARPYCARLPLSVRMQITGRPYHTQDNVSFFLIRAISAHSQRKVCYRRTADTAAWSNGSQQLTVPSCGS